MVPIEEVEVPVEGKFRLYHLQLDAKDCKTENYNVDIGEFVLDLILSLSLKIKYRTTDYIDLGQPNRNHRTSLQFFENGGYLSLLIFDDINEVYMDIVLPEPFDSEMVKEIFERIFKPIFVSLSQSARQA